MDANLVCVTKFLLPHLSLIATQFTEHSYNHCTIAVLLTIRDNSIWKKKAAGKTTMNQRCPKAGEQWIDFVITGV